jgi:hypothetical protein
MTKLSNVVPFPGADKNKTYLLLISPESIPHLCIIHNGLYYSLTYKECENAKDFNQYLQFLLRAKRKMLFVEIDRIAENPWNVFKKYEKLAGSGLTCLQPVKETILENSKAEFVFELIQELQNAERITQVYQMNMEPDFKDQNSFNLREYTKDSIFTYIQALNEKHTKKQ